jgi:hypothetical protein
MTRGFSLLFGSVLGSASALAAAAEDLTCRPEDPSFWMQAVRVRAAEGIVMLRLRSQKHDSRARLVYLGEKQFGFPTYAFNLDVKSGNESVVHLFKLFRVAQEWRLIDAGIIPADGTYALKALGKSTIVRCEAAGT